MKIDIYKFGSTAEECTSVPVLKGKCDWPTLQPDLSNIGTYSGFLSNK